MRRTLLQLAAAAVFAYGAIRTGTVLTDYDMPTSYVVLATYSIVMAGFFAVNLFRAKPRTYACPKDCGLTVTVGPKADAATEQRMRNLAADHAAHTGPRP